MVQPYGCSQRAVHEYTTTTLEPDRRQIGTGREVGCSGPDHLGGRQQGRAVEHTPCELVRECTQQQVLAQRTAAVPQPGHAVHGTYVWVSAFALTWVLQCNPLHTVIEYTTGWPQTNENKEDMAASQKT